MLSHHPLAILSDKQPQLLHSHPWQVYCTFLQKATMLSLYHPTLIQRKYITCLTRSISTLLLRLSEYDWRIIYLLRSDVKQPDLRLSVVEFHVDLVGCILSDITRQVRCGNLHRKSSNSNLVILYKRSVSMKLAVQMSAWWNCGGTANKCEGIRSSLGRKKLVATTEKQTEKKHAATWLIFKNSSGKKIIGWKEKAKLTKCFLTGYWRLTKKYWPMMRPRWWHMTNWQCKIERVRRNVPGELNTTSTGDRKKCANCKNIMCDLEASVVSQLAVVWLSWQNVDLNHWSYSMPDQISAWMNTNCNQPPTSTQMATAPWTAVISSWEQANHMIHQPRIPI